jgi:hypothetical protein
LDQNQILLESLEIIPVNSIIGLREVELIGTIVVFDFFAFLDMVETLKGNEGVI